MYNDSYKNKGCSDGQIWNNKGRKLHIFFECPTFNFLFHVSILNTFYMLHITMIGIGPNDK
jgi:hypothetical protein